MCYNFRQGTLMEIAQDKLDLIEKVIKNNNKYISNEDLYEDFFNETCKRSLSIVKTLSSDSVLEAYLRKIATTSIISVLKDSGRLRRTKAGYTKTQEIPIEEVQSFDYSNINVSYGNFNVQESPETIMVKNDVLKSIYDAVVAINEKDTKKQYLQIYKLRYDSGMTQQEISDETGLSQSEISKRLFKLMEKVKQSLN